MRTEEISRSNWEVEKGRSVLESLSLKANKRRQKSAIRNIISEDLYSKWVAENGIDDGGNRSDRSRARRPSARRAKAKERLGAGICGLKKAVWIYWSYCEDES